MRVLIACEYSGRVREAFRKRGHDAWSCDLLPAEDDSPFHFQEDVGPVLERGWDLVIAHPPCQYLAVSGLHWNARLPARAAHAAEAVEFFMQFTRLSCRWAIENPIGCMSSLFRKPDQIIQPYQFGHDASKRTCLWLNNLPLLIPTKQFPPRMVGDKARWGNQTDDGQNVVYTPKGTVMAWNDKRLWKERSRTFQGIAEAMADQWGGE